MGNDEGRIRVVIENVEPEIDCGLFPVKRVVGEKVKVTADIFSDGHDQISAMLLYRKEGDSSWQESPMNVAGNDRWEGEFSVESEGVYRYAVQGWIDRFKTWQRDFKRRYEAEQDLGTGLLIGAELLDQTAARANEADRIWLSEIAEAFRNPDRYQEAVSLALNGALARRMKPYPDRDLATVYERELSVVVDREKARFSAWYELFPRSSSLAPKRHGTFRDLQMVLPEISRMGFDVLYLPPIHPIGRTNRKGRNNTLNATDEDVGSPWAIGAEEGGHKAVHPRLGTLADFEELIQRAAKHGLELAMDLAFQCSPDHPYVKSHPEWFRWRPDGTLQFAENPPKKYEDIVPFDFETAAWRDLWEELKSIPLFWMEKGVRIFRVDNPHTKPFAFWQWLIGEIKRRDPGVLLLSEAFTRPRVMYRLAKLGFTQSYTYFTWRTTKSELTDYLIELTRNEVREYFQPNLWPNTPDILPEHLQYGGRAAFMIRLFLVATLSSSYGVYGPAFDLCVNEALAGREEYLNAEKYELKHWDRDAPGNLRDLMARLNRIRKENPALQSTSNLRFHEADNDHLLFYAKTTEDLSNSLLAVVNIDPFHTQSGWVKVPTAELGIDPRQPYLVHDLLSEDRLIWHGERNYVELNPRVLPAALFLVRKKLKREADFDYFM
jgi:starch synthase (maltosyl-transferring)